MVRALALALVAVVGLVAACEEEHGPRPQPPVVVESNLAVAKAGDGAGIVRTLPAGLICDTTCPDATFVYENVDEITVVAELGRNANFRELRCEEVNGAAEDVVTEVLDDAGGDEATVVLPMIVDDEGLSWSCTADFILVHTMQVIATQGAGTGRVRGSLSSVVGADEPKRMDCASNQTCVAAYFDGEVEVLTATADAGSVFAGWDFCDNGTDPVLTFTMTDDENCRPRFDLE